MYTYIFKPTKKELHGWYVGDNRRECTAERLLINPYNGCSVGCFYCYARALPGNFEQFHFENKIFVAERFDEVVKEQLDELNVASCGYLSPVTDPFQEIEKEVKLSEKIVRIFVEYNLPIEFITKCVIPQEIIELIKYQEHSFGQVSILTCDENLRKIFSPGGATTDELFNNLYRLAKSDIFAVCRIDPIFPFITDKKEDLKKLVLRAKDNGAKHIIASVLDIPVKIVDFVFQNIKKFFGTGIYYEYKNLYTEHIGYLNAKIDYRLKIFDFLRNLCDQQGLSFALCMEYRKVNDRYEGLNKIFMSSYNCEGIDIPVYVRLPGEKKFHPVTSCKGACLTCKDNKCNIPGLAQGIDGPKGLRLKDYKNFSKDFVQQRLNL